MTGKIPLHLPLGFETWNPILQALALGLMTFVQEDIPTVSSALLASAGKLAWQPGFIGCFLGIWIGDLLLYAIARGWGRPLLEKPWAAKYFNPEKVRQSERWFAQRGIWLVVSSRFVPGTRLPTYVAAGFLKLPFYQFALVTGCAVAFWTTAIFTLSHFFGDHVVGWLEKFHHAGWILLLIILGLVVLMRVVMAMFQKDFWKRMAAKWGRLRQWEYWPPLVFYWPVIAHYTWLSIKHRSFMVPTAANPGIFAGGLVGESKMQMLKNLMRSSPEFTAKSFLIESTTQAECVSDAKRILSENALSFPFILKPDLGQRGGGVKLIRDESQLEKYFNGPLTATVLQEYSPGPFEAGVFYYRLPNETRGHIFSITEKIFPYLEGDGKSTLEELMWQDSRARFMYARYLSRMGSAKSKVLTHGEKYKLVEAGNHAQGCIFCDGKRMITPELEMCIDAISRQVPGFFVGRYDIRYASEADLKAGKNFQIIELNGASAEATHIYDSRYSVWSAYRTLRQQWRLVFDIGAENRRRGNPPMKLSKFLKMWYDTRKVLDALPIAD